MKKNMKWFLIFAIGLALVLLALGGCNFMNHIPSPAVFTPTLVDEVNKAVEQTLTAMATELVIPTIEIIMPTNTAISVITNTPPATPTPQPTEGPTETPEPTVTQTATITPTGYPKTMTGDPRPEFIHIYFDAINREDYETAWNNLTLEYRKNKHYNWLPHFVEGYEDMNLCEVEINDISIVTQTSTYAKMFAQYIYKIGEDCNPYTYYFEAHFNYDAYQGRWLLNGLTETD
jgi:hypothetical protein